MWCTQVETTEATDGDMVVTSGRAQAPTREDVLDAAAARLRRGGPSALSMRRLAEDLGCSYQVVYSRVGDKHELVRALHDRGFDRLSSAAAEARDRARAAGMSDAEVVEHVALGYLAHAAGDPVLFDVMFGTPVEGFVRDEQVRSRERTAFAECWIAPVRSWYEAGGRARRRGAATALAWQLWAAVHGITTVHLAGHPSPSGDPREDVRAVVRLLLRAAAAEPTAPGAVTDG